MPLSKSGVFTHKQLDPNIVPCEERGADILSSYHKTIGMLSGIYALIDLSDKRDDEVDAFGAVTHHCVDRKRTTVAKRPQNGFDKPYQDSMADGTVEVLDSRARG